MSKLEELQASLNAKKAEGQALMKNPNATAAEINAKAEEIKSISAQIDKLDEAETGTDADDAEDPTYADNIVAIRKQFPGVLDVFEKSVRASERQRIHDIDDIAGQVAPALLNMAKYEKPITAKDLAFEQMKHQETVGAKFLQNFKDQTQKSNVKDVGAAPTDIADATDDQQRAAVGKKLRDRMSRKLGR